MKLSLASSALVFSFVALTSYACSSSTSGGSTGGDTDAGSSSQDSGGGTTPDSGGSTTPDSGGPQQSACGTGTFSCNGIAGATTCQIATQYCQDGMGCSPYIGSDPCPTCTNPPGECGVDKTLTCSGNDQSGVTVFCN